MTLKLAEHGLFINFVEVFKKEKRMSLNKVMLIGNVGKDPDIRYVDKGVAVASFSLATTERGYRLPNGTEVPERKEWHNVVLWKKGMAETAEKYVHKGDKLFIEGKIRSRSYDDQKGVKRYITEIFADSMEMLSPRNQPNTALSPSALSPQPAQVSTYGGKKEDLPF